MVRTRSGLPREAPLLLPAYGRMVEATPDVLRLIRLGAPVAIGVSGGKDSCAAAFATVRVLDECENARG